MTITQHLARLNRWARRFLYLVMADALGAFLRGSYYQALCGVKRGWTHGAQVFVICIGLLVVGRVVLGEVFKCPLCKASLEPDDKATTKPRTYVRCPFCASDFSQPMPRSST